MSLKSEAEKALSLMLYKSEVRPSWAEVTVMVAKVSNMK
jgi:hypothetical protein